MIPVIISGGSGTRLWPVSRQSFPKQFCELLDESLFQKTAKRVLPLGEPWVVTTAALKVLTYKALSELKSDPNKALCEPMGRNTAPAIALLCQVLLQKGLSNEVVGVFPADQLIDDDSAFREAVLLAEKYAREKQIVTLGVTPTYAATGFGYIELSEKIDHSATLSGIIAKGFREKPNFEKAQEFVKSGNFMWNAGMFVFQVSHMISLLEKHLPKTWQEMKNLKSDLSNLSEVYSRLESISIDYAVMEKLPSHVCIPCRFSWNDVGSWDALSDILKNQQQEQKIEVSAKNNFVFPYRDKTYAFVGAEDLLVVDTADALLVAKKGQSEKVKDVVEALKKTNSKLEKEHVFEVRPWGQYEILRDSDKFKSKVIEVSPGAQISYQSHAKREEIWVIVDGAGEVVLNDKVIPVKYGSYVHIPMGAKHQVRNTSNGPLRFVEVQLGSYFGEDDIVRYSDIYGRA